MRTLAIVYKVAAVTAALAILAASALTSGAHARSLPDTRVPTHARLVHAHKVWTYAPGPQGEQCKRTRMYGRDSVTTVVTRWTFWRDVAVYSWRGVPLGHPRWDTRQDVYVWRTKHGRVTFDGITFRNGTRRAILAAGYC